MAKTRLFDEITPDLHKDHNKNAPVEIEVYCWACQKMIPISETTLGGRHDEDQGGCGCYIR